MINSYVQRYRKKIQPLSKASVNDSSRTAIIANSARSKWKLSGCSLRITSTKQRNYFAALTHLHALKHIVGQTGGFQTVDVMTTRIVIFADKRLAYARLEAPVFTKNQQLATLGMTPVLASPRLGRSPTDYGSPHIFSAYGKLLACYATSIREGSFRRP